MRRTRRYNLSLSTHLITGLKFSKVLEKFDKDWEVLDNLRTLLNCMPPNIGG
jgi:hypothetical protein